MLLLSLSRLQAQNKDLVLIESFIKEIILEEDFKFSNTKKFINYNNDFLQNEAVFGEIMFETIKYLRKELANHNLHYEILSDQQTKKNNIDPNFKYHDSAKVYHVLVNNKVMTSFVIEEDKIALYSYNLSKSRSKPNTPHLLN